MISKPLLKMKQVTNGMPVRNTITSVLEELMMENKSLLTNSLKLYGRDPIPRRSVSVSRTRLLSLGIVKLETCQMRLTTSRRMSSRLVMTSFVLMTPSILAIIRKQSTDIMM